MTGHRVEGFGRGAGLRIDIDRLTIQVYGAFEIAIVISRLAIAVESCRGLGVRCADDAALDMRGGVQIGVDRAEHFLGVDGDSSDRIDVLELSRFIHAKDGP